MTEAIEIEVGPFNPMDNTHLLIIKVRLERELFEDLDGSNNERRQHRLVDIIAGQLHEFVSRSFNKPQTPLDTGRMARSDWLELYTSIAFDQPPYNGTIPPRPFIKGDGAKQIKTFSEIVTLILKGGI